MSTVESKAAVPFMPAGYTAVTPYLVAPGVAGVIDFLRAAFGAELSAPPTRRLDGSIRHADVVIGGGHVMMGEPANGFGPMPAMVHLYLPDVDAAYRAALDAGAESLMEPTDFFYGDRGAGVKDAAGNIWWISTHIEDVPHDEIARRAEAAERAQAQAQADPDRR